VLPGQGGNSGKYLTTNGTIASWGELDSDLTAIAALSTTAYGRSYLTRASPVSIDHTVSPYTAAYGQTLLVNSSGGAVTINLPAAVAGGSSIVVLDVGGDPVRHLRVTATRLAPRQNDFIFALGELQAIGGENHDNLAPGAVVSALDSIEAGPRWGRANLTDGIWHREIGDPVALAELRELESQKTAIERELADPAREARLAVLAKELAALNPELAAYPKGELVYAAATDFTVQGRFLATGGKPREIRLLQRGDIRAPGDLMRPGLPPLWPGVEEQFHLPPQATESAARAELARAVTSPENPLFWRSIVNRLWLWTFGQPLVGTPNDFGRMGQPPTHPELLDFLAGLLRDDSRHSLKSLVRLLDKPAAPDPAFNPAAPNPATSWAPHRVFNIGNSNPIPLMSYIEAVENALGITATKTFLPMQPGDVPATAADTSALEAWIGFRPNTSVNDGVARFVAWYREFYQV
jgi:hypothetical protein